MILPFTTDQFFGVFKAYNTAIQPLQIVIYILAIVALVFITMKLKPANKLLLYLLSLMWFINGIGYHIMFFSKINPIAKVYGGLFVIQAIVFAVAGFKVNNAPPEGVTSERKIIAWIIIAWGMFIYSLLGIKIGHVYPSAPIFGVAPCPTTIFTFGAMMLLYKRVSRYIYIIPFIWAAIGATAAFKLGIREDNGLLTTALFSAYMLFQNKLKRLG